MLSAPAKLIACSNKALEFNPELDEVWNNRGIALKDLGKLEEAIAFSTSEADRLL
ncbi:MAG: tetratricopeptide repeat protein [Symploca sp. SIO2E6]|nr:tetratricopeptide repeat protein [Symploca sp. SIO2E6]